MEDVKEFLESEVRRLAGLAKGITEKADAESRQLTDDETAEIERLVKEANGYKQRIKEREDAKKLREAIEAVAVPGTSEPSDAPAQPKTAGEAFVKSDAYRALRDRGLKGRWSTGAVDVGMKLTDGDGLTVVATTGAGGNLPMQPQIARAPFSPFGENPLVIAGLFGQGQATQNTIVYLEETTTTPGVLSERYSDSDATVTLTTEGSLKPAANVDFTKRSTSLDKIAAFLPVSDEMIEDEPAIVSYINSRLALFIRQAEDAYLLDELLAANIGTATSTDIGTDENWFDAIAAGIERIQEYGGLNPDAVLMNPRDFWTMSVSKSAGDGNYFGGSPYAAAQRNPWGLSVVVTAGVNKGTAIVGAFREGATVWRKGGVSVEASNSHDDYFRRNLTALRAEERLALTVYRPSAFARVTR